MENPEISQITQQIESLSNKRAFELKQSYAYIGQRREDHLLKAEEFRLQIIESAAKAIVFTNFTERSNFLVQLSRAYQYPLSRLDVREGDTFTVTALLKALEIVEQK